MDPALLPALIGFAFVSLITPGPNNLMVMSSGARFGVGRSMPHVLGIALGFSGMIAAVGLGLMGVFEAVPGSQAALRWASLAYLLWLAWHIAAAPPVPPEAGAPPGARPLGFWGAVAFQWINPKAWAMALTALAAYTTDHALAGVLAVAGVFLALGLPCILAWTALGHEMRRVLTSPARMRAFNVTMALLLVASVLPVLWH